MAGKTKAGRDSTNRYSMLDLRPLDRSAMDKRRSWVPLPMPDDDESGVWATPPETHGSGDEETPMGDVEQEQQYSDKLEQENKEDNNDQHVQDIFNKKKFKNILASFESCRQLPQDVLQNLDANNLALSPPCAAGEVIAGVRVRGSCQERIKRREMRSDRTRSSFPILPSQEELPEEMKCPVLRRSKASRSFDKVDPEDETECNPKSNKIPHIIPETFEDLRKSYVARLNEVASLEKQLEVRDLRIQQLEAKLQIFQETSCSADMDALPSKSQPDDAAIERRSIAENVERPHANQFTDTPLDIMAVDHAIASIINGASDQTHIVQNGTSSVVILNNLVTPNGNMTTIRGTENVIMSNGNDSESNDSYKTPMSRESTPFLNITEDVEESIHPIIEKSIEPIREVVTESNQPIKEEIVESNHPIREEVVESNHPISDEIIESSLPTKEECSSDDGEPIEIVVGTGNTFGQSFSDDIGFIDDEDSDIDC